MGSRFPIPGMQPTSNFISVKVTNWFDFVFIIQTYVYWLTFSTVYSFLPMAFFPKEGFGQGDFNKAPHAIRIAILFYIPRRFYIPCSRPKGTLGLP